MTNALACAAIVGASILGAAYLVSLNQNRFALVATPHHVYILNQSSGECRVFNRPKNRLEYSEAVSWHDATAVIREQQKDAEREAAASKLKDERLEEQRLREARRKEERAPEYRTYGLEDAVYEAADEPLWQRWKTVYSADRLAEARKRLEAEPKPKNDDIDGLLQALRDKEKMINVPELEAMEQIGREQGAPRGEKP